MEVEVSQGAFFVAKFVQCVLLMSERDSEL